LIDIEEITSPKRKKKLSRILPISDDEESERSDPSPEPVAAAKNEPVCFPSYTRHEDELDDNEYDSNDSFVDNATPPTSLPSESDEFE